LSIFILCCLVSIASAETIYLKNGRSVTGTIVEKTDRQIKVEIDGFPLTYYLDEVDRIGDGASLSGSTETVSKKTRNFSGDNSSLALRYMEVSGVKESMRKTFDNVISQAPEQDRAKLSRAFNVEEIVLELVPVYDRYFTDEELQDLIDFYQSPTGQKVLEVNPMLLKDSMEISYRYFEGKL